MDNTYSFDDDFIKNLGSLEAVKEWSNGRHEESALVDIWNKVKPVEVPTKKVAAATATEVKK